MTTHYLIRRPGIDGAPDRWLTDHGSWSPHRWQAARVVRKDDAAFSARAHGAVLVTVRAYGVRAGARRAELLARLAATEERLRLAEAALGTLGFGRDAPWPAGASEGTPDHDVGVAGSAEPVAGQPVALASISEAPHRATDGPLVYAAPGGRVTLAEEERAVGTLSGTWPAAPTAPSTDWSEDEIQAEVAHLGKYPDGVDMFRAGAEAQQRRAEGATAPGGGAR